MRWRPGVYLVSMLLLTGCQSAAPLALLHSGPVATSIDPAEPVRSDASAPPSPGPAQIPGREIIRASGPDSGPVELLAPEPTSSDPATPGSGPASEGSSLTLSQALDQSLLSNPDLIALRGQVNVHQAIIGVARTYPWNPTVQAQYFPRGSPSIPGNGSPASAAGLSNYYVSVMQRLELAHQRRFRIENAEATLTQVQWNIFQGELQNVAQTTRLYFAAVYEKEVYDLTRETAELHARLADIVEQRFKANLAKAADVTTARVAARQAQRQAELAQAAHQAALLALRQQCNLPLNAPISLSERLADIKWLSQRVDAPTLTLPQGGGGKGGGDDSLQAAELVEGRPDVMAARAGVNVSQANYNLARAAMVPDLQAGPIYQTADDGTKYFGVTMQINLPVFDTGRPLVRQRRAEMSQQQLTYAQLKVRAALEAQSALDQYERLRQLAAKGVSAPPGVMAPELKEMIKQFQAGQADILAVIATQDNLLQERRLRLDLLGQLAQAAAAVIQSTGLSPQRVIYIQGARPGAEHN